MLTELEKKLIASIQEDIAVTDRPYLGIAKKLGISEETLLGRLQSLCNRGFHSAIRCSPASSENRIHRQCHGCLAGW